MSSSKNTERDEKRAALQAKATDHYKTVNGVKAYVQRNPCADAHEKALECTTKRAHLDKSYVQHKCGPLYAIYKKCKGEALRKRNEDNYSKSKSALKWW